MHQPERERVCTAGRQPSHFTRCPCPPAARLRTLDRYPFANGFLVIGGMIVGSWAIALGFLWTVYSLIRAVVQMAVGLFT